ncbi:MAG: EpsG family protein [Bacteroidaceae bacterium]|nr:EpsG family protein [Bacteroidaceae bacterium]
MIYLVAFILILVPVIRFDLMKLEGNKSLWLSLNFLMMVMVAGLRYRVGGDTLIYMDLFDTYPAIDELSTFDFEDAKYNPCWYIYNSIFKSCGNSFTLFQIVQAVIVNGVFFRFFKRQTSYYFTAILVYFFGYYCYYNMEIQREVLSLCFMLEAYPFLVRKKLLQYYLLCVAALFFHTSAVVMFLFPLVLLIKKDYFWVALLIIGMTVLMLQVLDVINIFLSIAVPDTKLTETIASYLMNESPNIIGKTVYILKIVPFIMLMFVRNRHGFDNDMLVGKLIFFAVAIQSVTMYIPVTQRFSNYIFPLAIVYVVNTFYLHYWDIRPHLLSHLIVTSALFIYGFNLAYFYLQNRNDDLEGTHVYNRYLPYNSVFDPQSDNVREQLIQNERATRWM